MSSLYNCCFGCFYDLFKGAIGCWFFFGTRLLSSGFMRLVTEMMGGDGAMWGPIWAPQIDVSWFRFAP